MKISTYQYFFHDVLDFFIGNLPILRLILLSLPTIFIVTLHHKLSVTLPISLETSSMNYIFVVLFGNICLADNDTKTCVFMGRLSFETVFSVEKSLSLMNLSFEYVGMGHVLLHKM